MDIEIKISEPINIKYGEKTFSINRPKVIFFRGFMKRLNAAAADGAQEDSLDVMIDFCEKIGVPAEIMDVWSVGEMTQFFKLMSDQEKKS